MKSERSSSGPGFDPEIDRSRELELPVRFQQGRPCVRARAWLARDSGLLRQREPRKRLARFDHLTRRRPRWRRAGAETRASMQIVALKWCERATRVEPGIEFLRVRPGRLGPRARCSTKVEPRRDASARERKDARDPHLG